MTLFGIGWVIWEKGFAKMIVPATWRYGTRENVESMVNTLVKESMKRLMPELVKETLKENWKRWIERQQ